MKIILIDGLVGNDYAACLAEGLSTVGADVTLIVPSNRKVGVNINFEVKYWLPSKGTVEGVAKKFFNYLISQIRILNYIFKNKNSVIHYQFFRRKEDIFIIAVLKLFKFKVVYTAHNVLPHESNRTDIYFYRFVYMIVSKIIVHSEYIKYRLQRELNVSEKKIFIIPHGNFDFYIHKDLITSNEARFQLHISPNEDVLLFFGFIREYKGLDLLLDSFSKATSINNNLRLVIAGEPGNKILYEKYEKLINNSIIRDKIIYNFSYIPVDKIQIYFNATDFVVLPYKNIDHSGIVHLAYSFAKPVIATNVGDFSETIEEGKSGYLVEKNNIDALTKIIINAFNNKGKIIQMGKYANELSSTKYSWIIIAKNTLSLYYN